MTLHCSDFEKEPGFPGCCASCHDDEEQGHGGIYDEYLDPSRPELVTHLFCCKVSQWYKERAKLLQSPDPAQP